MSPAFALEEGVGDGADGGDAAVRRRIVVTIDYAQRHLIGLYDAQHLVANLSVRSEGLEIDPPAAARTLSVGIAVMIATKAPSLGR